MIDIVNMASALTSCEAPNIAAAAGQGPKADTGTEATESVADGFRKKLQDCEAMIAPVQPPVVNGSIASTDDGIQTDPGLLVGASGTDCLLEGLEMPQHPTDVAGTLTEAAVVPAEFMPVDGMAQGTGAAEQQPGSTDGPIAWTQNTTAGDNPVITQDEILKTVGAYLDVAADVDAAPQTVQPQPQTGAQKATQNSGSEPKAAADGAKPVPEGETGTVQTPAAPKTPAAPQTAQSSGHAPEEKTEVVPSMSGRREATAQEDIADAVKPQSTGTPITEAGGTIAAAGDIAAADVPETQATGETQYTKENVLRIVDKVSTHASEGKYDFDVELKPDFLGKVSIKLTMEDGSIRMQIKTDDLSVRSLLSDQTSSMQNALKEKGITLTNVDVSYESQASPDGGRQPFEQHGGSGRQGGAYYAHTEAESFEPSADPYSYYMGNSSVEFLA